MTDFDFEFCDFIDHDMSFITYADFCNKCKTTKELYKPLNNYQKRFYKWYLYSNINMTEYLKNIIWDYLNDYDENGFELLRIKRIQDSRRKGKLQPLIAKEILGCDFDYLIKYLIQTYEDNYNEKWNWEYLKNVDIDHIIPLATADTEDEIKKLCHYTNLQLLKTEDNLKKGNRLY